MTGRLANKVALVTGAAQGIGAQIAATLAGEGADVVLSDINGAAVAETAARIAAEGPAGRVLGLAHDVTSEADWIDVLGRVRSAVGGLSVLVNNAGIVALGSVEDLDLAAWRQTMAVNVDSVFLGCKYALPLMRERQPGSIVNLASISALVASHNMAAYNASKAALWMLTKSVALHCARQGWNIRCNSVHPTFVRTPLLDEFTGDQDREATLAKLARQVPMGRIAETGDVAAAVVYLASDESGMMTASEIKLDGGLSAM